MKLFRIFYLLVTFSLLHAACSKDESPEYFNVLGTINKTNDSIFVISDKDERLLVNNASELTQVKDSARIIAYFTMSDKEVPSGVDYVIDIYYYTDVLLKPLVVLTDEIADSIGNDPLEVTEIWVSKDYLNLGFQYYGSSSGKIHYINLIRFPGEIAPDTVELEIRHNANEDYQTYLLNGFVNFDLRALKNEGDSVVLHVKAKENFNPQLDKYLTYKF
jgi:hypothetical protein